MRGKRRGCLVAVNDDGIIPAHTGKTAATVLAHVIRWAHPHSCGENRIEVTDIPALSGSSPLMRGKHARSKWRGRSYGLIPAHAGKTHATGY